MLSRIIKLLLGGVTSYLLTAIFGLLIAVKAGPVIYGQYLICVAIASFMTELFHGRLDLAFAYIPNSFERTRLLNAATMYSFVLALFCLGVGGVYVVLTTRLPWNLNFLELAVIVAISLASAQQVITVGAKAADGAFTRIATARVTTALVAGVAGYIAIEHYRTVNSLLIVQLFAYVLGVMILRNKWGECNSQIEWKFDYFFKPIKLNLNQIRSVLPGSLLFLLTWQLHLLMAGDYFSGSEIGSLGLAFKLVTLVTTIASIALNEPIRLRMLECLHSEVPLLPVVRFYFSRLIFTLLVIYFLAAWVLGLDVVIHFDKEWNVAIEIAKLLLVSGFCWTVVTPFSSITHLTGKKARWLLWQIMFFVSVAIPWIMYYFLKGGVSQLVDLYNVCACVFSACSLVYFFILVKELDKVRGVNYANNKTV